VMERRKKLIEYNRNIYQNGAQRAQFYENVNQIPNNFNQANHKMIYSNVMHAPTVDVNTIHEQDEEFPAPPSPVSSSYSELRRATDGNCYATTIIPPPINHQYRIGSIVAAHQVNKNNNNNNTYSNDYGIYGPSSQNSTTYESIYEPINPRPPSQMSSRSNYSLYAPYVEGMSNSSSMNRLPMQETEVDALTNLLVQSINQQANPETDNYGTCVKCNQIVTEASGCTAMENVYHIACFTCHQCQTSLQGKPFYALEGKALCQDDYMHTLEKCSVCLTPITERILRATGE
jgi:lipoma-prefererred partner